MREVLRRSRTPRYRSAPDRKHQPAARKWSWLVSQFFDLPGPFGDESHDRRDLPTLAAARIREHLQLELAPEQFIVIGDTPNDIECARHFGARSLAVGTGRLYSHEDIVACKPDALLLDFSNLDSVMETLAEL